MTRELLTEGIWKARGCGAELGFTSKGKDQVGVDFVLLEGPDIGKHVTWYGYFTDDSFERTIDSLRLCGWEGDDLSDLRGIEKNDVQLTIAHEPDLQGEIRSRAAWVNGLGGVAMKDKMDKGAAAGFAARMKGRVLALKQAGGGQAKRPTGAAPPRAAAGHATEGQPTDDIPF